MGGATKFILMKKFTASKNFARFLLPKILLFCGCSEIDGEELEDLEQYKFWGDDNFVPLLYPLQTKQSRYHRFFERGGIMLVEFGAPNLVALSSHQQRYVLVLEKESWSAHFQFAFNSKLQISLLK